MSSLRQDPRRGVNIEWKNDRGKEGSPTAPALPQPCPSPSSDDHFASLGKSSCFISDIHVHCSPRPRSGTGFPWLMSHQPTGVWPVCSALSSEAAPGSWSLPFNEGIAASSLSLYPLCPAHARHSLGLQWVPGMCTSFSGRKEGWNLTTNTASWRRAQQFSKCSLEHVQICYLVYSTKFVDSHNGRRLRRWLVSCLMQAFCRWRYGGQSCWRSSKGSCS